MNKSKVWLGLLAVLTVPSAEAVNREIRALFQPDPSQPHNNTFVNKTPNSGYCATYPNECAENQTFSIEIPVRYNSTGPIDYGIAMKVPADWRQLTITNPATQETEIVEVRITGFGSKYVLSDSAANLTGETDLLTGHQKLWKSSSWVNASPPCQYSGVGAYTGETYRFFWKTPVESYCHKLTAFPIPWMYFENLDFAYELRTPNPLGMSSGLYTGSLTYGLGSGSTKEFDFGPYMRPDDGTLTLDFVLDVQHTLKVDLPPGGNKVALEPEGGWQTWINGGPKPGRIFRDQTFFISASSRFKVMMQCQDSLGGERCRMYGGGNVTDVTTRMTLPAGITYNGTPVNRLPLRHEVWTGALQPSQYVDRQVGVLHFEIPSDSIDRLLQPGVGASLDTNITIIWDSEV